MGINPLSARRAVFLDRDGVLNKAIIRGGRPYPPAGLSTLEVLTGVPDACDALHQAGFILIVVTNQPDVARGTQSREIVEAINQALRTRMLLDDVRVCYHDATAQCTCRKPEPGLLLEAACDWGIDLSASFMIGDRWKDVDAGNRAGCRTVFIDRGYAERAPASPDYRAHSLAEAADWILSQPTPYIEVDTNG